MVEVKVSEGIKNEVFTENTNENPEVSTTETPENQESTVEETSTPDYESTEEAVEDINKKLKEKDLEKKTKVEVVETVNGDNEVVVKEVFNS